jgi:hypothetical protein
MVMTIASGWESEVRFTSLVVKVMGMWDNLV